VAWFGITQWDQGHTNTPYSVARPLAPCTLWGRCIDLYSDQTEILGLGYTRKPRLELGARLVARYLGYCTEYIQMFL